tara:strand:- start:528 stop:1211 length:684 start_codon:yes stop_codon:yes gene_type:complete
MEGGEPATSKDNIMGKIFNFDDDTQNELLNILQYSLLSVVPIMFLNKSVQKLIPEADEEKGSVEVLAEVVGQIAFMFLGMFMIHRLILAVPTYSKIKYQDFHVTNIVLSFLVIVLSLHTKLGEKTNILIDRLFDMIEGKQPEKEGAQNQNGNGGGDGGGGLVTQGLQQASQRTQSQNIVNTINGGGAGGFDHYYGGPPNPLVDANMPMDSGLMAANEALGGSFGTAF